jgi:UDP-N-acetylmuramyl pentapeptide phosphotransferase/UDP-N-acetylglucosamine-1-phosphate transferase
MDRDCDHKASHIIRAGGFMVFLAFVSFVFSTGIAVWVIRGARRHSRGYDIDKPQRFHSGDIPRLGGVAILGGLFGGWASIDAARWLGHEVHVPLSFGQALALGAVVVPTAMAGIVEDLTQRVGIRMRLLFTALSGVAAWLLLDLSLNRLGIPWVDTAIAGLPMLGVLLAVFAICGLPHAFNIIDGYNGLAGTVALMVSLALAHVALQVGDRQLAAVVICLAASTAGFLVWNYPRGLLFAGDGGAYLWGVVIAISAVSLVQRHPQVSPWFPMLLLMYPVWETVFSIYRKLARGTSPGVADALHFHQLIYRRIVRGVFDEDASRRMLMRNNRTSPYLWGFTLLTVLPAVVFWNRTSVLIGFSLLFMLTYVGCYLMIVRFKVPRWLRR